MTNLRSLRRRASSIVLPLVVALMAAPIVATPIVVHAADDAATKKEARTHYDRAVQLYKEGAYEAAFAEFERAYQIFPSWRILFNMAEVRYELNQFASSLTLFRRYLHDGGKEVPPDKQIEVDKLVLQLETRVATVRVVVDSPGAIVSVDDVPVGKSPLAEPLLIDIGHRKITASKDGKVDAQLVTVVGGDKVEVQLTLGISESKTINDALIEKPPSTTKKPSFPVVPWVVTGVLAASAITFGAITLSKGTALANERDNPNATRESLDSKSSSQKTFAITTDVLTGAALIAGGISLYLTLSAKPSSASGDAGGATVHLGLGPGSVALTGSF